MHKILFIEGRKQEEENISELLTLSNYRVTVTNDGSEGIRLALEGRPDLILCDVLLPLVDGYEVIRALQEHPATRGIPVILLTSSDEDNFRKAMKAGADDFLARPFEGIELLRAVEASLERHHHRLSEGPLAGSGERKPGPGQTAPDTREEEEWRPDRQNIRPYKKRTMLYLEGQRASQVWFVVSGKVKTYMIHTDGKELITSICGPGDCVGCVAAVHGDSYTDNAQVLEDASLVVILRPDFLRLMSGDPAFIRQMIKWLSRSSRVQDTGLLNLAYSSLRKKVANGILSLFDSWREDGNGKGYISISRENLAAIIGSAPESLTRTLSDFKRERLIEITDGRIYLLNEHRLRNLIN